MTLTEFKIDLRLTLKWMYFVNDLLTKYNNIWDKVSADIKKELDSELVYNKNFLRTKIKSYCNKATEGGSIIILV